MIYLVDFGTCYKIGKTQNLRKRLQNFLVDREQVACLDVVTDLNNRLNSRDTDSKMEKELHNRCEKFHIVGELFQKDPEVLKIFSVYKEEMGDTYDYSKEISELFKTLRVSNNKGYDNLLHGQNKRKVYQYDTNGVLIKEYLSMSEAIKETGARVDSVIYNKQLTSVGYIWADHLLTEDEIKTKIDLINNSNKCNSSNKTLKQYSLEGEYIQSWKTMSEAGKELGIAVSSISLCCKGNYKTAGGFIWRLE